MKGFTTTEFLTLLLFLAIAVGWAKNVSKLVDCDFQSPYKCEAIHGIGLFPPIGAITGWMNIEDGE